MIREALNGLGIVSMDDPMPGPGVPSGMSYSPGWSGGSIPLVGSLGQERTATYRAVYLMNPWVFAATNYIARGIGRLPLHVFELDENGEKTRVRGDVRQSPGRPSAGVRLDRILNRPTGRISRASFYGATMRDRLIYGPALWEIQGDGLPDGLRRIPWRNVTRVEFNDHDEVAWYEVSNTRGIFGVPSTPSRRVLPIDVVHFGFGADTENMLGISVLESCRHTLALHEAVMRHLMGYMENSMRPSGMFFAETAKAAKEARALISELYSSPEHAGEVLVTNAKWQGMADTPEHGSIIELIKESRVEIAAAFQVPPPVLGLLEHAIRANVKEMREQFGRETVGPWATEFEDDIEAQLLPKSAAWDEMFVEFQLAEQLRPDLEARALVYQRLMWVMAVDEIRQLENLPPLKIEGVTDVPWVASGAMPLPTAAEQRRTPQAPPRAPANGEQIQLAHIVSMLEAMNAIDSANGNGHAREVTVT